MGLSCSMCCRQIKRGEPRFHINCIPLDNCYDCIPLDIKEQANLKIILFKLRI